MRDELNTNVECDENYANEHLEKLNGLKKHVSVCHLNTQSMSSTFAEFQFVINQTNFDVAALSEMWLKNVKNLLEYVRLPSYKFAYRNWDEKCGRGVRI